MNVKTYNFINLDYLEMMADGDDSMKKIMLEMLLDELPMEIEKMSGLITDSNWQELSAVSHKMKSTLAFVGNDEMTNANKDIEQITKDAGDVLRVPDLFNTLKNLYPKVTTELNQELSGL